MTTSRSTGCITASSRSTTEKMSKSKNNFFTVKDILKEYPGEVIRFFILQTHYRSPLDFSDERLKEAEKNMEKLKDVIARVKELSSAEGSAVTEASKVLVDASDHAMAVFHEAMDDDFNTGLATGAMFRYPKRSMYTTMKSMAVSHSTRRLLKRQARPSRPF